MKLLFLILAFWLTSCILRGVREYRQQKAEKKRSAELARLSAEWRVQKAQAELETKRLIALEREQMRQAREQEKLEREQQRQAEVLAKHEEQIAKLEFRLSTAESDISHWNEQIAALYAILDMEQLELAGTVNGSKEQTKHQKKIITLNNQIHAAENRLNKAKFEKSFCEDKLAS